MKIEELNAHISSLYVENLRLRASEIALQSQLKREKVKSHKIMADAEAAVSNAPVLMLHRCSRERRSCSLEAKHRAERKLFTLRFTTFSSTSVLSESRTTCPPNVPHHPKTQWTPHPRHALVGRHRVHRPPCAWLSFRLCQILMKNPNHTRLHPKETRLSNSQRKE